MTQTFQERRGAHRPPGLGPAGAVPWLIAAVAIVLVVVYATGWWGGGDEGDGSSNASSTGQASAGTTSRTTTKTTSPSATKSPTSGASTPAKPTVNTAQPVGVLNATGRSGLAAGAAAKLRADGWTIRATGNYTGSVQGTTVFYGRDSLSATAQAVADDLGGQVRVQESADFGSSRVTVVLGADYVS